MWYLSKSLCGQNLTRPKLPLSHSTIICLTGERHILKTMAGPSIFHKQINKQYFWVIVNKKHNNYSTNSCINMKIWTSEKPGRSSEHSARSRRQTNLCVEHKQVMFKLNQLSFLVQSVSMCLIRDNMIQNSLFQTMRHPEAAVGPRRKSYKKPSMTL